MSISSSMRRCRGSASSARHASITSVRLCGGMLVAMPTAMPDEPLTSRFGMRAGSTARLLLACRRSSGRNRPFPCRCRRAAAVGDLLQPALGVAHRRRRCRRRPSRSCPGRRSADSAARNPAPSAPARRRSAMSPCGWYLPITSPTTRAHLTYGRLQNDVRLRASRKARGDARVRAVADVRQRPTHDYAHCVIEVANASFQLRGLPEGVSLANCSMGADFFLSKGGIG